MKTHFFLIFCCQDFSCLFLTHTSKNPIYLELRFKEMTVLEKPQKPQVEVNKF